MRRRKFIIRVAQSLFLLSNPKLVMPQMNGQITNQPEVISLFLSGDVMTGRGIDQILPHPSDPRLYEPYVRNAKHYVELAERVNGHIPKPVDYSYIWGDALKVLQQRDPDVRIINLETSITESDDYWRGKGINYRMHPKNIPCLMVAGIDCCVLANNHVLDWGYEGLAETQRTLREAKVNVAGAGNNESEAMAPAILNVHGKGRVVVFSFGLTSSGIPWEAAATTKRPGVNLLPDLSTISVGKIKKKIQSIRQAGDVVVASIHWGGNWGYNIPSEHTQFAHQLIDTAGVDVIHGHSSHHAIACEIYKDKPIIYGCGDLLNDYEGIGGYEAYRDDLALMYFLSMATESGKLSAFEMVPFQIKRFRLNRSSKRDAVWLQETLNREGRQFNHRVELSKDLVLSLGQ